MRFDYALTQWQDGSPARRASWPDGAQVHLSNNLFHYTDNDGTAELFEFSAEDVLAGDWEMVSLDMTQATPTPTVQASEVNPFD